MAKEWPAVRKKLVNFGFMGYKMKKTLVHPLGAVSVGLNGPLAVPQLGDFQSLPVRRAVYSQNYLVKGRHQLYWLDYSGVWTARAASHQQADASDTSGANTAALVFPVDCPNKPAVLSCVASCGFIFALYSPALYVLRESKDNSSGLVNLEFVTQCDLSTAMSSVDVPLAMVLQDAALSAGILPAALSVCGLFFHLLLSTLYAFLFVLLRRRRFVLRGALPVGPPSLH